MLRECKPRSEMIKDISLRIFGQLDEEPREIQKKISLTLFDDLVCHLLA